MLNFMAFFIKNMAEFVFHDTHCQTNSFPAVITTPIRF